MPHVIALASRQHGVVARPQLLAAGVHPDAIDSWLVGGRLRRIAPGVYVVATYAGAGDPPRAREMAAVLLCGPHAVLSHDSAARMWRLMRVGGAEDPVHVTVPGVDRGRVGGVRPHRVRTLDAADRRVSDGIPVTSPARTLVDIAGSVSPRILEQAWATAERDGLAGAADVLAALDRKPRSRGGPALRWLVTRTDRPAFTRSEAEERLLDLITLGALPRPETNVIVAGFEVDFLWRKARVVVEVDGFAYHGGRRQFEHDRRRDASLSAARFQVLRFTWRELTDRPYVVLVRLAQVLARTGSVHQG